MALDIPRVEYGTKDKKKNKISKNDRSISLNEESVRKARERREQKKWQKMKLSDLETQTNTEHNG